MKKAHFLFCSILFLFVTKVSFGQDKEGVHYGANETFKYWAGEEPWEGIDVKNGQYWSSAHFTKEYIMYMEVIVPKDMALSFVNDEYNKLELVEGKINLPDDKPDWFKPPKDFKVYKRGSQGSLYFIDLDTGYMFIYEIQL
tara:strand:- start:547 stop:969 length:423 start_codon:yes stop_codon:yes gene_type:complete